MGFALNISFPGSSVLEIWLAPIRTRTMARNFSPKAHPKLGQGKRKSNLNDHESILKGTTLHITGTFINHMPKPMRPKRERSM